MPQEVLGKETKEKGEGRRKEKSKRKVRTGYFWWVRECGAEGGLEGW